jgi:hypothetical protein
VSLFVSCNTQDEVDALWQLQELMTDSIKRRFAAWSRRCSRCMTIDIAALQREYAGTE